MGGDAVHVVIGEDANVLAFSHRLGDALGRSRRIGQTLGMDQMTQTRIDQRAEFALVVGQASGQQPGLKLRQPGLESLPIQPFVARTRFDTRTRLDMLARAGICRRRVGHRILWKVEARVAQEGVGNREGQRRWRVERHLRRRRTSASNTAGSA